MSGLLNSFLIEAITYTSPLYPLTVPLNVLFPIRSVKETLSAVYCASMCNSALNGSPFHSIKFPALGNNANGFFRID